MTEGSSTPLMRQYLELKRKHPDAILFFQVGDFYEMFFEDAEEASHLLNLTLTSRNNGEAANVPLAGVPMKAAEEYVRRLIRMGRRVAICQQVEAASQAQGLVRREVVETVTPGAIFTEELLAAGENNFLAAVAGIEEADRLGLAWADISTGEFYCAVIDRCDLRSELARIDARELLVPRSWETMGEDGADSSSPPALPLTRREDWCFDLDMAGDRIGSHFEVASLAALGLGEPGDEPAVRAAGALLGYLLEIQPGGGTQLRSPRMQREESVLYLDEMTRRNLEIVRPLRPDGEGLALIDVVDGTRTPMGARTLRAWLLRPLCDPPAIRFRLDAVEELFADRHKRNRLRENLRSVRDLERLAGRAGAGRASPRDLLGLAESLRCAPAVAETLGDVESEMLRAALSGYDPAVDVCELIESAIDPEAPAAVTDGQVIRNGYSAELDESRSVRDGAVGWIAELQGRERQRTGIASLKVGYNRVFGYYIEVSKPNVDKVPDDYERRQTLTNSERYVTPELKEWESRVLTAEERIQELESRLYREVRDQVGRQVRRLQDLAERLARIDVLAALADVAERNRYVRPRVDAQDRIEIRAGRHPVVERVMPAERFVPNDIRLDEAERIMILTGPNMAGKSTILRQVGLITLLAQMGSFVPAEAAEIGVADRIFTRVGASDNLAQGQSTFMVEMIETAAILNGATERSLVLLDEIGRGTSTYDGVSIAWSVTEYLHERLGPRTVFATHYHELTQIADLLPRVVAYNVAVKEVGDEVVFLRRLERGGADRSYGVQVARLAGLPGEVIARARQILKGLEGVSVGSGAGRRGGPLAGPADRWQLSLFEAADSPAVERLRRTMLEELTPLEALNLLAELKRLAEEG